MKGISLMFKSIQPHRATVAAAITALFAVSTLAGCGGKDTSPTATSAAASTTASSVTDPNEGITARVYTDEFGTERCAYLNESDENGTNQCAGTPVPENLWDEIEDPATDDSTNYYKLMAWYWYLGNSHLFDRSYLLTAEEQQKHKKISPSFYLDKKRIVKPAAPTATARTATTKPAAPATKTVPPVVAPKPTQPPAVRTPAPAPPRCTPTKTKRC